MKSFYFLLTALVVLAACNKNNKEIIEDPQPEAAFTRTIDYTLKNSINKASYNGNALVESRASVDGNQILISLSVMPKEPGTTGDAISFRIDKSLLQQGLQNTYSVDGQTTPIVQNTRYLYMVEKQEGGFWSSIHETSMGLNMEGNLVVASYDADRKLLTGSFHVVIKDLISDPTRYRSGGPVDPMDRNTVTITGTFKNVKLLTE